MNKKFPYIFLLLAIGIQLLVWIAISILMKFSFCPEPKITEENATTLIACFLAAGGLCGIVFSALGIYYTVLRKKLWTVLSVVLFLFLPLLFVSALIFYAFLVLSAIL